MADEFPQGCTCERINVDTTGDVPGTQWIRGRSDPPCRVHLPQGRALYDAAYRRGHEEGYNQGYAAGFKSLRDATQRTGR